MPTVGPCTELYAWSFPASELAIGEARKNVLAQLVPWAGHRCGTDVEVMVSELVTNAILHSPGPGVLTLRIGSDSLRVEVTDAGGGAGPKLRRPDPSETSGRGLLLVDALANAWGVQHSDAGRTVWFELALPARH